MKDVVETSCTEVPNMEVWEEESVEYKVTKIDLVVKESKKKIVDV